MPFQPFDEWFAVLDPSDEQKIFPGRIIFDPRSSIKLLTVDSSWNSDYSKLLESGPILGLLDYQRPATLLDTFISVYSNGTMSADTRYLRRSFVVTVNAVLKNIHLDKLESKVFLDLRTTSASFQAWLAWKLIESTIDEIFVGDCSEIRLSSPVNISHQFPDQTRFKMEAFSTQGAADYEENFEFQPVSSLIISFPQAVAYKRITNISQNIDNMFAFLIGVRLYLEPDYMLTNKEVSWNNENKKVIAENLFVPAWNRKDKPPYISERMFTKDNTPVPVEDIIERCLSDNSSELFNWISLVLAHRMSDLKTVDAFFEMVGSLERIDNVLHGNKENGKVVHLRRRLERLIEPWKADGFRGSPDLAKIVLLRNMRAHGRSGDYIIEHAKIMGVLNQFLDALMTYHILKILKFDRDPIAKGFRRSLYRLGFFVPDEFRN